MKIGRIVFEPGWGGKTGELGLESSVGFNNAISSAGVTAASEKMSHLCYGLGGIRTSTAIRRLGSEEREWPGEPD